MTRVTGHERFLAIDLDAGEVTLDHGRVTHSFESPEAFAAISCAWLRCGWYTKYVYSFTWMGRPIVQLPDAMVRLQDVIYSVRPDVTVETAIAHGGSLVFSADLCKVLDRGTITVVDVEIRRHNRTAIEDYGPKHLITVAMDGIMKQLSGAHRIGPDWAWDNPRHSVRELVEANEQLVLEEPSFPLKEESSPTA